MEQLPDVPLLMILRFIDDPRERTRLELVCRRWRKIMKDHGWKHVQQIALRKVHWVQPIGARCGAHLVECSFHPMDNRPRLFIDSELLRLIAENFPALQHLEFRRCIFKTLDENMLAPFMELGARLRSLSFFKMYYEFPLNLLCHFSSLRHLGLHLRHYLSPQQYDFASFPSRFFADLRSLYLSSWISPDILIKLRNDSPRLSALYLDSNFSNLGQHQQQLLNQISKLKNLRFLRIGFDFKSGGPEFLGPCLIALSQLHALKLDLLLNLRIEHLSAVVRSLPFRGLIHLSLALIQRFENCESIGHLSNLVPQLRSFNLDISAVYSLDLATKIGYEILKMAKNGILECLNVPYVLFTVGMLDQLIQQCPNLHSLCVRLEKNDQLRHVAELRHIVVEQWRAGTRKHLPLRVWIYGRQALSAVFLQDPFLAIRTVPYGFTPPNPVLEALFRDEVFVDGGETPSFVTEQYSTMTRDDC